MLLLIVAVQAIIVGPFTVGLPLLVEDRLGDPRAYGIVMSAFSAGALGGMLLAGVRRPSDRRLGTVLLGAASLLGFGLVGLALAPSVPALALVGVVIGAANGFVGILLTSWLQPRVPAELVGRVMSLVMFAMVAVVPLSSPVAGALIGLAPTATIAASGLLMAAIVLVAATRPTFRGLGLVPLAEAPRAAAQAG
jgi:MFS family permease